MSKCTKREIIERFSPVFIYKKYLINFGKYIKSKTIAIIAEIIV